MLPKVSKIRWPYIVLAFFVVINQFLFLKPVHAGALSPISITTSNNTPSEVSSYNLQLKLSGTYNLGSILIKFCLEGPIPGTACTLPSGMVISNIVLGAQSGNTGFNTTTAPDSTSVLLTRTLSSSNPVISSYTFNNVTNPNSRLQSIYVRVSTYSNTSATGNSVDYGAAIFSTQGGIGVGGYVPPYLKFCTSVQVNLDCSQSDNQQLNFGNLSTTKTATATSQFSGSTNDESGFSVFIAGTTLSSGTNYINNMVSNQSSVAGTSQFGLNLRDNSSPDIGNEITGRGTLVANTNYNQTNLFRFNSGELIASSSLPTEPNIVTVSYIANINGQQAPGQYSTTLNFIASASF